MSEHREGLYTVKTLEKAIDLINLFDKNQPEMSLKDIALSLKIPKATAFRLVYTLEKKGYLQKNYYNGTYQLGLQLLYLGSLVTGFQGIVRVARPYLLELNDETNETVELTVLNGNQMSLVDKVDSKHFLRASKSDVEKRIPLHCTAAGKTLAAYSKTKIPKWPPKVLTSYTKNTITDLAVLYEELDQVRVQGYALDREELSEGVTAVGAPILNDEKNVVAAITVVAPTSRVNDQVLGSLIYQTKKTADRISKEFCYG